MKRLILHIDMDAFFASVEQRDFPHLRGKPVAVGGSPQGRGVVAAASYEARAFGVRSAMPAAQALRLCPQLHFVKHRFEVYRGVSHQIRDIFEAFTGLIEPLSLDEAFLDVTDHPDAGRPEFLAQSIRQAVADTTQLTCSAGIAPNKFLAKVASDMHKPNGQFYIPPEAAFSFIQTLPIRKFYGIGPSTEKRMKELGIQTGGDLQARSEAELVQLFGKTGHFYYQIAQGLDDRPVRTERIRKSVSVEETFFTDLRSVLEIRRELYQVCVELDRRLHKHQLSGRTVSLKIRYENFETHSHQCSLQAEPDNLQALWQTAKYLLEQSQYNRRPVRLLGLGVSNLKTPQDFEQELLPLE